ncbi:MAG: type II toxin-antitoxin system RelE/ParE family toxin [Desulfovibrionaceae bacterium]|nr:type II toxin-antitoxin system RelE/ParE family toxin [Desulfovibrionaceae bacterium]
MIRSFRCRDTERLFHREAVRKVPSEVLVAARRKLLWIDAAVSLEDLRLPPGNRLETLKGDRKGQYSIRINDRYRICFVWKGHDAHDVEIVDYH